MVAYYSPRKFIIWYALNYILVARENKSFVTRNFWGLEVYTSEKEEITGN